MDEMILKITSLIWHFVMPICMALYMTTGYKHANHAFKVNVRS